MPWLEIGPGRLEREPGTLCINCITSWTALRSGMQNEIDAMGGGNYDLPLTKEYVPLTPELRNALRNFASNGSYGREDRPRRRSERLRDEWSAGQRSRRRFWDGSEAHEFKNLVEERLADPETDFPARWDRVANLKQAGAAFRGIGHHEIPLLASADADS